MMKLFKRFALTLVTLCIAAPVFALPAPMSEQELLEKAISWRWSGCCR